MSLLQTLITGLSGNEKKEPLYSFGVKDEDDDVIFAWFVMDANAGCMVFRCERPDDRKTEMEFQRWFKTKNEAIEYAVDQGRAEKIARGL